MKTIATIALVAMMAGTGTYALAQQNPAPNAPAASQDQGQQQNRRPRMSQDDFNRLVDARIASIKAGLKLTPDQERLWTPVETAIRTSADQRFSRFEQRPTREQRQSMDFMQRLEQRSTRMNEGAQRSAAVTNALRPLWNTFSEDQKRIAPRLMREALNTDGPRWNARDGRRGQGRDHHRMGMHQGGPRGPVQQQ